MSTFVSTQINTAVVLVILVVVIVIARKARRMKRDQDELMLKYANKGGNWFRINVARPGYFAKRMKLMGLEAKGLLVDFPDHILVVAKTLSGEKVEKRYNKSDMKLQWIGNPGVGSANMHWLSVGAAETVLMISADTGFNALQSREATADICRSIAPQFALPDVAKSEFALEKNRASLALVVGFFVLLAYAAFDGFVLNENELITIGHAMWGLPLCVLPGLLAYPLLTKSGVPSRESVGLCMLVMMAVIIAYVPFVKRVDQWLAKDGAQAFAYTLKGDAKLDPVAPGPPPLNFRHAKEYWAQFEAGSTHHFQLTHGPLGLWQLDHTELGKNVREFYEKREGK